jgi:hypothetical protein
MLLVNGGNVILMFLPKRKFRGYTKLGDGLFLCFFFDILRRKATGGASLRHRE